MHDRLILGDLDLFSDDFPDRTVLADWLRAARTGDGSPWLTAAQAEALVEYALERGQGVRLMEAVAPSFREPVREIDWEIIGADPDGENWDDHRDPASAHVLFRKKLRSARRAGVQLHYKLWIAAAGT